MIPFKKSVEEVYSFILGYETDNGYTPTLLEIGERFERTKQWAVYARNELERQGKIVVKPRRHRGIVIINT